MSRQGNIVRFPVERTGDAEMTPLQLLDALTADIKSGKYRPHALLVSFVDMDRGNYRYPYVAVGFNPLELGGLLAKIQKAIS